MAVWLVDHGERDGLGVVSRSPSAEAAARLLRDRFAPALRVEWEPLDLSPDGDEAVLVGHVAAGPGSPAGHTTCYCMHRVTGDTAGDTAAGTTGDTASRASGTL